MVHQTMNTSIKPAPKASSKISHMLFPIVVPCPTVRVFVLRLCLLSALLLLLAACATPPSPLPSRSPLPDMPTGTVPEVAAEPKPPVLPPHTTAPATPPLAPDELGKDLRRSRWTPVPWDALPGWHNDPMGEAWAVLLSNCERPGATMAPLCPSIRRLSLADEATQRNWLMQNMQAHRVESWEGEAGGLLTGYYEPVFEAQRLTSDSFATPLYAAPAGIKAGQPWFTRQEIETAPQAQNALRGKAIAWLSDPVDALVLQIQGSGRLRITEADGSVRMVRLAYAASNEHPYQSIGRWLLDNSELKDASWPGIKAWVQRNPQRVQALLWVNPRYVFFREEALPDPSIGPRGAQGLPLIAGRSIAVDPQSIPYGTPLWLVSPGPTQAVQRLVVAQDTGSAIVGAVRADLFMGTGWQAGELAGRMKQPLRLWVLWPK